MSCVLPTVLKQSGTAWEQQQQISQMKKLGFKISDVKIMLIF
jgi:hypothetical protein